MSKTMNDDPVHEEHPDDKAYREEGEREAAEFGDALTAEKVTELRRLLTIYADADAHDALDDLRSWFWAGALPSAVAKKVRK